MCFPEDTDDLSSKLSPEPHNFVYDEHVELSAWTREWSLTICLDKKRSIGLEHGKLSGSLPNLFIPSSYRSHGSIML